ncbi:MAG TPA: alpha/beta hydrolase [Acidimicrobiales bacterium]|nr:alpha/beta hydrolase [Acidimicrobiales bacterium]
MAVTPEVQNFLAMLATVEAPPASEQTPDEVREAYAALSSLASREDVGSVADRTIPGPAGGIPVRIYTPVDGVPAAVADGTRGVLVFFHGGGWTIGSIETHDPSCRALANGAGVVVVSVEYRLAPEHPFPAAIDDALAAMRWVTGHTAELGADPGRVAVGGDSAGGNLAAVVARELRDAEPPLRFQLLVYPATDMTMSFPSIDENGDGYFLTKDTMSWFRANYMSDGDHTDGLASPLHADPADLAGVAPALVVTAEYDPLRDEGEAYAEALRAAGVAVTATRYDGVIHGFFSLPDILPEGKAVLDEACQALRTALA